MPCRPFHILCQKRTQSGRKRQLDRSLHASERELHSTISNGDAERISRTGTQTDQTNAENLLVTPRRISLFDGLFTLCIFVRMMCDNYERTIEIQCTRSQ